MFIMLLCIIYTSKLKCLVAGAVAEFGGIDVVVNNASALNLSRTEALAHSLQMKYQSTMRLYYNDMIQNNKNPYIFA